VARAAARQISFADVELMRQGVRLEPLLEAISSFLDRQHEMIERVRRDLVRGLKKRPRQRRSKWRRQFAKRSLRRHRERHAGRWPAMAGCSRRLAALARPAPAAFAAGAGEVAIVGGDKVIAWAGPPAPLAANGTAAAAPDRNEWDDKYGHH
jgi:hypothetical protein